MLSSICEAKCGFFFANFCSYAILKMLCGKMYKVFLLSWPLSGGKRVFVNGLNNNRHADDLLGQIVYRPI